MGSKGGKIKPAKVCEIEDLSARVRRIRFAGRHLKRIQWAPGDKIKLKTGGKLRSYTPARVDPKAGWLDVIFFLHGNGPASRWAAETELGEAVKISTPVKSMAGAKKAPDWALFLGDETAIGLAVAMLESLPDTTQIMGAIELGALDAPALSACGLPLSAAIRQQFYGDALLDWLAHTPLPEGRGMVWLSGEAISVRGLKRLLSARKRGRVRLKTKAYWSCKGHAHRTEPEQMDIAAK